jgi:gamma-glutamyltranspeptidase/glutathione hydrolase
MDVLRRTCSLFLAWLICVLVWGQSSLSGMSALPAVGTKNMVVTAQHDATDVGIGILRQGGNAFDAAVAIGYALAVSYPSCGNLGGGGFMTIHCAHGKDTSINFREKAPFRARRDMYLDADGNVIPGLSTVGYLASTARTRAHAHIVDCLWPNGILSRANRG